MDPLKHSLTQLSLKLSDLHKDLLITESRHAQDADQKRYSPYEVLQMCLHDPRFDWLKMLSSLITQIDQRIHSQEEVEILDVESIYDETDRLFHNHYPEFSDHYNEALKLEPHLYMRQADVLQALEALQPLAKDMHEMHSENEKHRYTDGEASTR